MFGIDDAISSVSTLINTAVTRIWPDATETEKAKIAQLTDEINNGFKLLLGQIEINKIEAKSESLFKSGWRPFVGWSCGFALVYASIIEPFLRFIAQVIFGYTGAFPAVETYITLQVLLGMLGLAGMRSFEKKNGVHK